jgi:DNA primase
MDVVEDPAQRTLLAGALMGETRPPEPEEVSSALQQAEERVLESRQRELRGAIADAERRGDFPELALLTQRKLDLDRELRRLHGAPGRG